ncbi:MAG TPA: hypothetical protein HPP76_06650 [Desulfuromonadales bacterium]|nr:hypothetical protein [Desulfuromonadales bacterium]
MKKVMCASLVVVSSIFVISCGSSTTQFIDYTATAVTAVSQEQIDLKASILQADLPSGNRLTVTMDQVGSRVSGVYTVKTGPKIISSGTISGLNTEFTMTSYPGSACSTETFSIRPSNISSTGADTVLTGNECGKAFLGQSAHLTKFIPKSSFMSSYVTLSDNSSKEIAYTAVSADNVNFLGTVILNNYSLPITASGTFIGTMTNTGLAPVSADQVVEISNQLAIGFEITRVTNLSGHFFTREDILKGVHGFCKTAPSIGNTSYKFSDISTAIDWVDTTTGATQTVIESSQNRFDFKSAYTLQ